MQKTVLDEVYDLLKKIGAVDNESEFSRDWLARSECYMRTLRFNKPIPARVHLPYVQASFSTTDAV